MSELTIRERLNRAIDEIMDVYNDMGHDDPEVRLKNQEITIRTLQEENAALVRKVQDFEDMMDAVRGAVSKSGR